MGDSEDGPSERTFKEQLESVQVYIDQNKVISSSYLLIKIQNNHKRLSWVCQYEGCLVLGQDTSSLDCTSQVR